MKLATPTVYRRRAGTPASPGRRARLKSATHGPTGSGDRDRGQSATAVVPTVSRMLAEHKPAPKVAVAVARELAGFLWAPATTRGGVDGRGGTRTGRARVAKVTDAHRHESEDRRASYAIRIWVPTRAPRLHVLSTKHCHACSAWATGVTTGYQRDSSSKRPMSSVTLVARGTAALATHNRQPQPCDWQPATRAIFDTIKVDQELIRRDEPGRSAWFFRVPRLRKVSQSHSRAGPWPEPFSPC